MTTTGPNPNADTATGRDALRVRSADASELLLPIAGLGSRSYAFIIDWHIRALLAGAWVALIFAIGYVIEKTSVDIPVDDVETAGLWLIGLPAGALYFLYHPVLEIIMHGRTPGKRMAQVRIVTHAGATPRVGAILIRNAFRIIDAMPSLYIIGLAVGMFTRHQVRIGDLAAGTLLVRDERLNVSTFDTVADRVSVGTDLRTAELRDDLLARWSSLQADTRRELGLKLLNAQGVSAPQSLRGRKLDKWLRTALREARDEQL